MISANTLIVISEITRERLIIKKIYACCVSYVVIIGPYGQKVSKPRSWL